MDKMKNIIPHIRNKNQIEKIVETEEQSWNCFTNNDFLKVLLVFKLPPWHKYITVFTVFRLLTDFVCLYTYEFWRSLWKIVRSSVILLLPLFSNFLLDINKG
jgi:hypothetical protein